jgi:hypothetical protein
MLTKVSIHARKRLRVIPPQTQGALGGRLRDRPAFAPLDPDFRQGDGIAVCADFDPRLNDFRPLTKQAA